MRFDRPVASARASQRNDRTVVLRELSEDSQIVAASLVLREFARSALPGDPIALRVGKFDPMGQVRDAGQDAAHGRAHGVQVYS